MRILLFDDKEMRGNSSRAKRNWSRERSKFFRNKREQQRLEKREQVSRKATFLVAFSYHSSNNVAFFLRQMKASLFTGKQKRKAIKTEERKETSLLLSPSFLTYFYFQSLPCFSLSLSFSRQVVLGCSSPTRLSVLGSSSCR